MVFKEIVFGMAEYRLECALRHAVLRKPHRRGLQIGKRRLEGGSHA